MHEHQTRLINDLDQRLKTYGFKLKKLALALLFFVIYMPSLGAAGFSLMQGDIKGYLDTTLTYGTMWRVQGHKKTGLGYTSANSDDGNRNFDTGLVSNQGRVLYELELRKEVDDNTFGFFSRGFTFWDTEIKNATNDHNSSDTNNSGPTYNGSLSRNNTFTDETQDKSGSYVNLRDLMLFGEFAKESNHPFSIRVGKQVVSWGESLFIQAGISSIVNPTDFSRTSLPGTEVKEVLLPVYQIFGSAVVTPNISISGYYQLEWKNSILPPVGTFLSQNDTVDEGGENFLISVPSSDADFVSSPFLALDRARDMEPSDSGQWGVSLNWFAEGLNETEFGFYFINYHRKFPDLVLMSDGIGTVDAVFSSGASGSVVDDVSYFDSSRFSHKYFDNIQLIGLSWNTVLPVFNTSFSGEASYHHKIPVQTTALDAAKVLAPGGVNTPGSVVQMSTREDVLVAQLTFNQDLNLATIADDISFTVESGIIHAFGVHNDEFFRGTTPGDQTAWGYRARLNLTYFDAFRDIWSTLSGTDLVTSFRFNHDVKGISAISVGGFNKHRKAIGVSLEATWQSTISANITFNSFFGAGDQNRISDRDNISFSLKYRF